MEFLAKLAEKGGLSLLLAISVSANYFLFRLLIDSYENRLKELNDLRKTTDDVLKGIKSTSDITLSIVQSILGRKDVS